MFVGESADDISAGIEQFLTGSQTPVGVDRVLATVLFTDIDRGLSVRHTSELLLGVPALEADLER